MQEELNIIDMIIKNGPNFSLLSQKFHRNMLGTAQSNDVCCLTSDQFELLLVAFILYIGLILVTIVPLTVVLELVLILF